MPWTSERYPAAMRRLPAPVRLKAIAIANALLEDGHDEGQSIRIGIAKAREWAARHDVDLPTPFDWSVDDARTRHERKG